MSLTLALEVNEDNEPIVKIVDGREWDTLEYLIRTQDEVNEEMEMPLEERIAKLMAIQNTLNVMSDELQEKIRDLRDQSTS
jgi:hypothetical protein